MTDLQCSIHFNKFQDAEKSVSFFPGIHVVYGDSGVGKSHFLNSIQGQSSFKKHNFLLKSNGKDLKWYRIFQNPDHQIIARTVTGELAFSGECAQKPPEDLKRIVQWGLERLPDSISPEMNPGFLSGGEKELLNLVTAIQFNPDILLIDDGMSFLSSDNKLKAIDWLKHWVRISNGVVVWATSDREDLDFGDGQWTLALDSFRPVKSTGEIRYEPIQLPPGSLSLEFSSVSFRYEHSREIYSELSLSVKDARCIGLLGDNGSGKTTFAGLCFGDLAPAKGDVKLSLGGDSNLRVGYMDQFPEHLIQLNTIDQFFTELKDNQLFDAGLENTFKNRLSRFGIQWDQVKDQKGLKLPWAVLRSILVVLLSHCRFDALILDEPTFGLGWDQRVILRSFLRECMTNMHFMIVSHDRTFIESMCDKIVDLDTLDIEQHSIGISKKTKS